MCLICEGEAICPVANYLLKQAKFQFSVYINYKHKQQQTSKPVGISYQFRQVELHIISLTQLLFNYQ